MKRVTRIAVLVSAAAALAVGGAATAAFAAIPASDGTIDGCYAASGLAQGQLYVIDSGSTCPTGYTALNWSQQGPTGPAGPAGANGVSGYNVVSNTVTASNPAGSTVEAIASCPSGDVALGGGGSSEFLEVSVPVMSGADAIGWRVVGRKSNYAPGDEQISASVWAICATLGG